MVALHIFCMLFSYAAFLVAFISGLIFLLQEYQLKNKRMGALFRQLPSLDALDRINFFSIGAGFLLLSLGTLLGLIGSRVVGKWWMGDPKEVLTVGLWAWYLVLWIVRLRSTLRGRRIALLSVLGFSFVLFTGLGASFILSSLHPYDTDKTHAHPGDRT
jgi:ABC-type transport system involved in cytochrome c biogenesis permease subunit